MASNPIIPSKTPAPGWVGGFWKSKPKFPYPHPDLSALPMLHNMDNIPLLRRQLDVLWPEFSWETVPGDPSSRCFQMFAPDISRAGYDNTGRVFSIICPQQGVYSETLGDLNIEVTVNTQRGWVNESTPRLNEELIAADMTVTGKIWFGPLAKDKSAYRLLRMILDGLDLPFPDDKANAIQVGLHRVGDPEEPIISVRSGISKDFKSPGFARHEKEAWAVANVAVQIGPIEPRHNAMVDDFNALILAIFNLGTGNLLQRGNVLTWNVWVNAPTIVDQAEWKAHAQIWRHSIDTGHVTPDGPGTPAKYFNGTLFHPIDAVLEKEWDLIKAWVKRHVGWLSLTGRVAHGLGDLVPHRKGAGRSPRV